MLTPVDVTPWLSNALRYSRATDLRCSSVIVCFVTATFLDRDTALVLSDPLIEGLELRIQLPRNVGTSRPENLLFKIAIDLEHVAHFVRALKAKTPVRVGFNRVVFDRT